MTEKIVLVANSYSVTFIFRKTLVDKLASQNRLEAVVSTRNDEDKIPQTYQNTKRYTLEGENILNSINRILVSASRFRKNKVSAYHGFTHAGNLIAWLYSIYSSSGLIITITGMGKSFNSSDLKSKIFQLLILTFYFFVQFKASTIIVQNADDSVLIGNLLLKWNKKKLKITNGSGVDIKYFDNVYISDNCNSGEITVGYFSRALIEKGISEYYELASKYSKYKGLKFIHVGHAGVGKYDEKNIKATAKINNVEYFEFVIDIRAVLMSVDIVVVPSAYREGLSRLVIESMLAGKIIVARETTGVRDHLINEVNAFLYKNRNGIFETFEKVIRNKNLTVGESAKSYALMNFDVSDVDEVYLSSYRQIIHDL